MTDDDAFLQLPAFPKLDHQSVTVRLRPLLDVAVDGALDRVQLVAADAIWIDLLAKEIADTRREIGFGGLAQLTPQLVEHLRDGITHSPRHRPATLAARIAATRNKPECQWR